MTSSAVPRVEVLRPEMEQIVAPDAVFEEIASEKQFTEGPVWLAGEARLVFSDIPADTMYAWSEADGVSIFRAPSHNTNGNTVTGTGG